MAEEPSHANQIDTQQLFLIPRFSPLVGKRLANALTQRTYVSLTMMYILQTMLSPHFSPLPSKSPV